MRTPKQQQNCQLIDSGRLKEEEEELGTHFFCFIIITIDTHLSIVIAPRQDVRHDNSIPVPISEFESEWYVKGPFCINLTEKRKQEEY